MSETIIVSLISFAGTILGAMLGVIASGKLTIYRIEQLEKKVEKHNHIVERMYNLEDRVASQEKFFEEKFKVANHRLDDLEHCHE